LDTFTLKNGRIVSVRPYEADDFEKLLSMFASLSEAALRYGMPPYDRARLELWTDMKRNLLFLALDGDRVIGVGTVWGSTRPREKGVGGFATYIHQDYQNQGLGSNLTRLLLDQARRRGFHRISLQVVAENTAAIRVYEKAGFKHEGAMKDAYFGDDQKYHDNLIMGIIL
jgi:RimJ/RimL family protein N-acetyltransferase